VYVWSLQHNDTVLTNYMQQSPSGETKYSSARQIRRILRNPGPCKDRMARPRVTGGGTTSTYGG